MIANLKLPGDVDFVWCAGLLFTELSTVTPNVDGFSDSDYMVRSILGPKSEFHDNFPTNHINLLDFLVYALCTGVVPKTWYKNLPTEELGVHKISEINQL